MTDVQNVVLVHGGFVDGSGWRGVYDLLTADGFNVSVVQNQTLSLESDVETTTNMLDLQDGPAILVGHSYGGAVITEAGTHDSVAGPRLHRAPSHPIRASRSARCIADLPPDGPVPPILPPQDGFLFLDRDKFADAFAADVPARDAAFMADSQVPWGVEALNGAVTEPAWRSKPTWYLVTTEDRMIPTARGSGRWPNGPARRRPRRPAATPSTSPSPPPSPAWSRRRHGPCTPRFPWPEPIPGPAGRPTSCRPPENAGGDWRLRARSLNPRARQRDARICAAGWRRPRAMTLVAGNSRGGIMSQAHPAISPARRDSGRALGS